MLKTDTWERTEEHILVNTDQEEIRTETRYEVVF